MATKNQNATAQNANPSTDEIGKVPTVDTFATMMEALKSAGAHRGSAVDAVCAYFGGLTIDHANAHDLDAVHGQTKIAKLTKLTKMLGALLTLAKVGCEVHVPVLNPADYV